jgi:DNA-binding transcriptional LysR family regulator
MGAAIEHGEIDVGLLAPPAETGSLHTHEIDTDEFLLALPDGYRLTGTKPVPRPSPATSTHRGHSGQGLCRNHHIEVSRPTASLHRAPPRWRCHAPIAS